MMNKIQLKITFGLIMSFAFLGSCHNKPKKLMKSPEGYDLNDPVVINLTKKIDQISGIAYSAMDSSLFAIDDDNGDLYKIPIEEHPKIQKWKFGKKADYEDLVLVDSTFYVLESKGKLFSFINKLPVADVKEYDMDLKGFKEFEILYHEPSGKRLVMLCKECKRDGDNEISAYSFALDKRTFSDFPVLILQQKEIEKKLGEKTGRIKASAATINPLTGEVYIISSINKLLIITDKDYNVKEVVDLRRSIFEQPEGICFAPDGTLFISSEAGPNSKASILVFKKNKL